MGIDSQSSGGCEIMPSGSLQDVRLGTLTQRFLRNGMEQRYELIFNKELIDDILIDQCSFRPSAARVSGPHSVYPLRLEHHVNNPSFPKMPAASKAQLTLSSRIWSTDLSPKLGKFIGPENLLGMYK